MKNSFVERRKPERLLTFDSSRTKVGKNCLCNNICKTLREIDFDWINLSSQAFKVKAKQKWLSFDDGG